MKRYAEMILKFEVKKDEGGYGFLSNEKNREYILERFKNILYLQGCDLKECKIYAVALLYKDGDILNSDEELKF